MAVTMKEVREALDPEEPNYQRAAALGPEALPHLEALVSSGDPLLASKATYLASLIQDPRAADVVEKAARSSDPVVRVAAAAAAANLGTDQAPGLPELANDPDPGVRKVARSRPRKERTPPRPDTTEGAGDQPVSAPIIIGGRMPGEADTADIYSSSGTMPGESSDAGGSGMPGERQDLRRGLMPGEKPRADTATKGEMPS